MNEIKEVMQRINDGVYTQDDVIIYWIFKFGMCDEFSYHPRKNNLYFIGNVSYDVIVWNKEELDFVNEVIVKKRYNNRTETIDGDGEYIFPQMIRFNGRGTTQTRRCHAHPSMGIREINSVTQPYQGFTLKFETFYKIFKTFMKKYCIYCGEDVEICHCNLEEIKKINDDEKRFT